MCARSQNSQVDLRVGSPRSAASSLAPHGWRRGVASSWRMTRSGRNSSRWSRRIASSRSMSSSLKSRYPPGVRRGVEQALVLEVADLRDRDVRELVAQLRADGADRLQPGWPYSAGRSDGRPSSREEHEPVLADLHLVAVFEPAFSMRRPVEERPVQAALVLDRERLVVARDTACARETVTSSRKIVAVGERPIVVRSRSSGKCSPARPPPERTTSAGLPSRARREVRLLLERVRAERHRLVHRPPRQQRAAAGAVVGRLRVLEAALGAVDVTHARRRRRALCRRGSRSAVRRRPAPSSPSPLLLEPRDELGVQDVDLAVQDSALVRDLVLLGLELVDQLLQVAIGIVARSGSASTRPFFEGSGRCIEAAAAQGSTSNLRLAPALLGQRLRSPVDRSAAPLELAPRASAVVAFR